MSSRVKKASIWDMSALFMGGTSVVAAVLLVTAYTQQLPVLRFFSEIILLIFLPVVLIYLWTEKVVEWMNVDSKVLDTIALSVRTIAIAMFILLAGSRILSMVKDIPNAVSSNYSYTKGVAVRTTRHLGVSSKKYVSVNGIWFAVDKKILSSLEQNANYRITYLPHSKYVIEINQENMMALYEGN